MLDQLRGLLDRNVLTALAIAAILIVVGTAAIAAVTGHYDSASVRAFIDDMKYLAGALGLGAALGRGLAAAGQRVADGHTEAALVAAQPIETAQPSPVGVTDAPAGPPIQPSQTGVSSP